MIRVLKLVEREPELAAIEALLQSGGGVLLFEGGAGIGKTSLVDAACLRAEELGYETLRSRGSELEVDFAFGIVRQLFERRLVGAEVAERETLLAGQADVVRSLLLGDRVDGLADDRSFAVLHGLYWLAVNLAGRRPLLLSVDDTHWADDASLRWLAYLAARLERLPLVLLVALRPGDKRARRSFLLSLRTGASAVVRPAVLSEDGVAAIVRTVIGDRASREQSAAVWRATGGNPFYVTELLRLARHREASLGDVNPAHLLADGRHGIALRLVSRVRALDPRALGFAQALAVLGDGCQLRHAATIAGVGMNEAVQLAAALVSIDVLAGDHPPAFLHPVIRDALEGALDSDERDVAHRSAAHLLYVDRAPEGQVAAHLMDVQPADDPWVTSRLRDAARAAMKSGAPLTASRLLERALSEPPPPAGRMDLLREAAHAEASAGRETACVHLGEALRLSTDPCQRAKLALDVAHVHAALFRWVDAVGVIEQALSELGDGDADLAARLEGELVVCGLHDARCAPRVAPVLERLSRDSPAGIPVEPLAVARGMAMVLAGRPAEVAAAPLEDALSRAGPCAENWDTRAALLWSLVAAERFNAVDAALGPMLAEVRRSGSTRGLIAVYSTLGLLKLRLGALPEADAAARVALRVLQEGDFAPGLAFAAVVLADAAVEAGEFEEGEAVLTLLPQEGWSPGVGTVLIPAARGRLRLAQGRPAEALADFQRCAAMFSPDVWGLEMRDVGYLHARAGAALALLRLGERERAREIADAELADVRAFGTPRALGIALRVAGLTQGAERGLELMRESVAALRTSPARLELAHSLAEFGAALRRGGQRALAREPLAEALDLAARCGARPLTLRVREELKATGARPRRAWRSGVEALTPSELRVIHLAAAGRSNREIAHELYVTLKTVEGHLSRAYRKLGIQGRDQLTRVLEEKTRVPTL